MRSPEIGRRTTWALAPVVLAVLLSGCGSTEPTVALPPLSARLAQIDEALAAKRFELARRDLAALAAETKAARAAGELSASRADQILDAIVVLRAALPVPVSAVTPTATPTPTPTPIAGAPTSAGPDAEKSPAGKGKGAGKGRKP